MRCPGCRAEYLLAFSCKTRELCPSCAAKRAAVTAALLQHDGKVPVTLFRYYGVRGYGQTESRLCRGWGIPRINRLGRGERAFDEEGEAAAFVSPLRDVANRDGPTVFAWALMSNHFHLAVRVGGVSLDRPMRTLQQRATRGVNLRRRVYGPLWQGRYKAKLVNDQRYLDQLLIYIHLNPVTARIVDDPAECRWSGHREVLGKVRAPIIDVDEVLRVFGATRRAARAAYVDRPKWSTGEEWIGEDPGRLPWWRLGRPPKGDDEDPEAAVRARRDREELGPEWRPFIGAEEPS